jgi:hypothetical protein
MVPNHSLVIRKLFDTGLYDLKSHDGQGAFVDACVSTLHGLDPNWGHLRKRSGQTAVHGHGEDAALYKLPDGAARAVDFIGAAGGPNPQPGWGVDSFAYKHEDWIDPVAHGAISQPPPPVVKPYPGDTFFIEKIGQQLEWDYAEAGQTLNAGSSVWFSRTIWRHVNEGMTMEQSTAQSRKEWRAALGLPQ